MTRDCPKACCLLTAEDTEGYAALRSKLAPRRKVALQHYYAAKQQAKTAEDLRVALAKFLEEDGKVVSVLKDFAANNPTRRLKFLDVDGEVWQREI